MVKMVGARYIAWCAIAVAFCFFFHELAHFTAGALLGNKMTQTLNSVYPLTGQYLGKYDYDIVAAAGPLFTILQALVCFAIMRRRDILAVYPFLLTPLYMRLLAMGMSVNNPNDEARVAMDLGIGKFTLHLLVVILLFLLVANISRRYHYTRRLNVFSVMLIMVFSSILILCDMFFAIHLL